MSPYATTSEADPGPKAVKLIFSCRKYVSKQNRRCLNYKK